MHSKTQADRARKRFARMLDMALNHLAIGDSELPNRTNTEIDSTTITRMRKGEMDQRISSYAMVVQAVHDIDTGLGNMLARELLEIVKPNSERGSTTPADYNRDGKEDIDDMPFACAALLDAANKVLMATIQAIDNGHQIDDAEKIELTSDLQQVRNHANAIEHLVDIENDKYSRNRLRAGGQR